MPKLISTKFGVSNARSFVSSFSDIQKGKNFFEYAYDIVHDGASLFAVGEQVIQRANTSAQAFVESANSTVVRVIDTNGGFVTSSPVTKSCTFLADVYSITANNVTGIEIGDKVTGDGIAANTFANSVVGSTVTLTTPTASAQTSVNILFNNPVIGQTSGLNANVSSISEAVSITKTVAGVKDYYWFFLGKHTTFPSDVEPPTPTDDEEVSQIDPYFNMIVAKNIGADDVSLMVPRYNWTANTVYTPYHHNDPSLFDEQFFVVVTEGGGSYSVFKCLDNAAGAPSLYAPSFSETAPDDDFYFTNDGYQWKFMYSFPAATYTKFATDEYIPVVEHANASANAISGSIDVIQIDSGGSNYNSYTNGIFQEVSVGGNNRILTIDGTTASSNTDFYTGSVLKITAGPGSGQQRGIVQFIVAGSVKRVVIDSAFTGSLTTSSAYEITPAVTVMGDGTGFQGRAIVNATSNSIMAIEITDRGTGYSWANVTITGNTGFVGSEGANTATATAVISPVGGHAFDPATELGAKYVCSSVAFSSTEDPVRVINANEFRQIGIIKNALLANVHITGMTIQTGGQGFSVGQTVEQEGTGATGVVTFANSTFLKLTSVKGFFEVSANASHNLIIGDSAADGANVQSVVTPTTYADQTLRLTITNQTAPFANDEFCYQNANTAWGYNFFSNTSVMFLTGSKGTFNVSDDVLGDVQSVLGNESGQSAKITGKLLPELVHNSGEIIYIENVTPIQKAAGQIETIKLILEF